MAKTYLILLLAFLFFGLSAQNLPKSAFVPALPDEGMHIDGALSEPQWETAAQLAPLECYFPEPSATPDGITDDVRLFYTEKGLYIAFKFADDTAPILSQLTPRDRVNANTDWAQIIINPFNDGSNDFNFYLSAAGVQGDSRATNDEDEDGSWNAVWYSAVVKTEHAWNAEIFIPYRVLRMPQTKDGEDPKRWGFNIKRSIRSTRTLYSWNPIDRNFDNESLQSGVLEGIRVLNPPKRISLRPNLTGSVLRNSANNTSSTGAAGADIKIGLNKSFTLDMTLLPDFSQVAYDEQFVNFGAFEQRFDENRQFFTEGVNLFNKAGLFYSRRIGGNPKNFTNANLDDLENTTQSFTRMLNASKVSGTTDKNLSIGMLNALTANNYAYGKDSTGAAVEVLTEPMTNYNVFAVDQRIGTNNSIGFINSYVLRSNATGPSRDARVSAVTTNLNLLNNSHFLNATAAQSSVYDLENPYTGFAGGWEMGKQLGAWRWEHELDAVTPNFDPNDLGFQRRGNKIHQDFSFSHQIQMPNKNLLRRQNRIRLQYRQLFEPRRFERIHLEYKYFAVTRSFLAFGYELEGRPKEYDFYDARVWGRYRINPASIKHKAWISSDFRKPFAYELRGGQWRWTDLGARGYWGSSLLIFRVNDQFNFRTEISLENHRNVGWAQTLSTDSVGMAMRERKEFTQSLEGQYLFGPNSYLTVNARHAWNRIDSQELFHLTPEGGLTPSSAYTDQDLRINIFNVDFKYVWWMAPGRELNLLYRASFARADDAIALSYWDNIRDISQTGTDQVFSIRLVYFLDYAELLK
jgi:hypothetical protein